MIDTLTAVDRLLEIADAYRELDQRLTGTTVLGGARSTPASRPPLDVHVADVRDELARWIHYLARWLMTEVTVERYIGPPWVPVVVAERWAPPTTDTADLAEHIARWRIGHFTDHPDPHLRLEFFDDLAAKRTLALHTAWPSGARWIRLHVPCATGCGGEYRMWMRPGQDVLGDMVCNRDTEHRISPWEWQRARRRKPLDRAAAARLAVRLRLVRAS